MRKGAVAFMAAVLTSGISYAHTDITPAEVKAWLDTSAAVIVVDVREESEFCDSTYSPPGHIPGAINMPWNSGYFQAHYSELPSEEDIIIVCRSGNRSNSAANFLDAAGFESVFDMTGGMNQWTWDTELCASAAIPWSEDRDSGAPVLGPVTPNPFRSKTELSYVIPAESRSEDAAIRIYDARGRLVTALDGLDPSPGLHSVTWDGTDRRGRAVTGGVYFCRFTWNGESPVRRVIVLK